MGDKSSWHGTFPVDLKPDEFGRAVVIDKARNRKGSVFQSKDEPKERERQRMKDGSFLG